jgi:hypothetical protein
MFQLFPDFQEDNAPPYPESKAKSSFVARKSLLKVKLYTVGAKNCKDYFFQSQAVFGYNGLVVLGYDLTSDTKLYNK